jgi:DNA-binding NarL/FixJ family response regulator
MTDTPKKMLLVDDHPIMREGIKRIIGERFDGTLVIDEVNSGEKALDYLTSSRPDIILIDFSMPGGMNGIQTIKQMRLDLYKSGSIILYTTYPCKEYAIKAGATDFYDKASDPCILMSMIARYLGIEKKN